MDPFNPSDQKAGLLIVALILLGFIWCVVSEIGHWLRHRREMKICRQRSEWPRTPPGFR